MPNPEPNPSYLLFLRGFPPPADFNFCSCISLKYLFSLVCHFSAYFLQFFRKHFHTFSEISQHLFFAYSDQFGLGFRSVLCASKIACVCFVAFSCSEVLAGCFFPVCCSIWLPIKVHPFKMLCCFFCSPTFCLVPPPKTPKKTCQSVESKSMGAPKNCLDPQFFWGRHLNIFLW